MGAPIRGDDLTLAAGDVQNVAEINEAVEPVERFEAGKAARYSVANFGSSLVYGLLNTAMPLYLKQYGVADWLIGLLANERAFVGALVQPVVGRISDRTRTSLGRRRPFFLVGVPLMSLSLLLLAFRPDFWLMLVIMTVGSFFLAVAQDPYIALLADLFPERHRGKVGGFLGLTTALGIIAFALMAFFLWESNQFLVFVLVIALLLLTYAFTFFTVKEPPPPAHAEKREPFKLVPYMRGLMAYPEAAKYTFSLALFWLGSGGATPFVTLFGTEALGATDSDVFLLPLAFVVFSAIFSIPAGLLADRIGKKTVMMIGLAIYGIGALVGSQSADLLQATIALAVIGIGNAGTAPLNPLLTELIPRARTAELIGVGSAVWSFVQPLGSVLAGTVVGLAALAVGGQDAYRGAFIFAGVMILLAALSLRWVHPERATRDQLEA
jgi:MFS family permease